MEEKLTDLPPAVGAAPREIVLDELHCLNTAQLAERARIFNLRVSPERTRKQLVADLLKKYIADGTRVIAEGIIEMGAEHYGFLRWPRFNFRTGPDDVYVAPPLFKRYGLRAGNHIRATLRAPRDREKFVAVDEVLAIEGIAAADWIEPAHFDRLTPLFPTERIILENQVTKSICARAVDLITPLGRGQRVLIVAPARVG